MIEIKKAGWSNVSTFECWPFLSDEGPTLVHDVRLYYPQFTNLFIFRFVSLLFLRSTLNVYFTSVYGIVLKALSMQLKSISDRSILTVNKCE